MILSKETATCIIIILELNLALYLDFTVGFLLMDSLSFQNCKSLLLVIVWNDVFWDSSSFTEDARRNFELLVTTSSKHHTMKLSRHGVGAALAELTCPKSLLFFPGNKHKISVSEHGNWSPLWYKTDEAGPGYSPHLEKTQSWKPRIFFFIGFLIDFYFSVSLNFFFII